MLNQDKDYKKLSNAIRFLAMDAVEKAQSGHPGMPMGMADVATVLFHDFLKFSPTHPHWRARDRFILSAGHGSMLLYALLYLTGAPEMTIEELKNFRQLHSLTPGHPEYGHTKGVETTTGPLGQGFANAVGMALAECIRASQDKNHTPHFTYTIIGDGCLMEGISQEALSFAGHLQLSKLIVFFDDNNITIDGDTSLATSEDIKKRFEANHWHVQAIDGHDHAAIHQAITAAQNSNQPSLIMCKTIIGYGAPHKAGTHHAHGAPLGAEEIAATRVALNWPHKPFEIPDDILQAWRNTSTVAIDEAEHTSETIPIDFTAIYQDIKTLEPKKMATRQASELCLNVFSQHINGLIGGSADLTGSNNTKTKTQTPITKDNFNGAYIYYGIREHAMAAIMNGLALYGGFIPYGGTFLVFSDYCRPAIRLSALMGLQVIYVMTHDSIGLGQDGPTHQPIEHLASLRAIPNILVLRPADLVETYECWHIALQHKDKPSILVLTRQGVPALRQFTDMAEHKSAQGGYILAEEAKPLTVTIIATGSEVSLACEVKQHLETTQQMGIRVVSMPSLELFLEQSPEYRAHVLGTPQFCTVIEAARLYGWERIAGCNALLCGIDHFGASAPIEDLYPHYGLDLNTISAKIMAHLK